MTANLKSFPLLHVPQLMQWRRGEDGDAVEGWIMEAKGDEEGRERFWAYESGWNATENVEKAMKGGNGYVEGVERVWAYRNGWNGEYRRGYQKMWRKKDVKDEKEDKNG